MVRCNCNCNAPFLVSFQLARQQFSGNISLGFVGQVPSYTRAD